MAIIVNSPMLIWRCRKFHSAIDGLPLGRIGYIPAEPRLERIAAAIGEKSRHPSGSKSGDWGVIEWVVAVVVLGIAVDTLPLSLSPANAPRGMASGSGNRDNSPHVVLPKVGILQREHTTHGASNHGSNLFHTDVIQYDFVDSMSGQHAFNHQRAKPLVSLLHIIADGSQREFRPVITLFWITVLVRHSTGTSVRTSQAVQTDDEKSRHIKSLAGSAQQGAPPIGYISAATQCMANDQGIVTVGRQLAAGCVGDMDIP